MSGAKNRRERRHPSPPSVQRVRVIWFRKPDGNGWAAWDWWGSFPVEEDIEWHLNYLQQQGHQSHVVELELPD